jgi:hypothetical protein
MIFINPDNINPDNDWKTKAQELTEELKKLNADERAAFIKNNRDNAWGHSKLLKTLRTIVGNKCWYSEVPLEGADPNVDHFRPKGRIKEVDDNFNETKEESGGYWWLAFEYRNFRLASMHSNQRRVDEDTAGGKWDYFPIRGARAAELTDFDLIFEDVLALDPCSPSDVNLLWFDPDGNPCLAKRRHDLPSENDEKRIQATIWLYHLDKAEIHTKRAQHIQDIQTDLRKANSQYLIWNRYSAKPELKAKSNFDSKIAEMKRKIADTAEFARAKQCAVRNNSATYAWIDEFLL